jgi:hypothetical protein
MRTSSIATLILVLACGTVVAQDRTVWVPLVAADAGSGTDTASAWLSDYIVHNHGQTPARPFTEAVFGSGSQLGLPELCSFLYPAHAGSIFNFCASPPPSGVGFLRIRLPPAFDISGWVSKIFYRCGCYTSSCTAIPLGRYRLPTYTSLFDAGSTAVAVGVNVGNPDLPPNCGSLAEQNLRRVNVTIFNAGDQVAQAIIVVRDLSATNVLSTRTVTVPPFEVIQFNRLALGDLGLSTLLDGSGQALVSITVQADRPFLSYVSTVFDTAVPGTLPFEVIGMQQEF